MFELLLLVAAHAQEVPGYSQGPFNLILRWSGGSPVVIRYDTRERCEMAALMAVVQGDALIQEVDGRGRPRQPDPQVRGPNAPYAFCIPG